MPGKDSTLIDPSKIECLPDQFYAYQNYSTTLLSPGAFKKDTYLYLSTKANSKVIDTLKFNSKLNILKEYPNHYLVCTGYGKSGYIKKVEVYLYTSSASRKGTKDDEYIDDNYLIGVSQYKAVKNKEYGDNVLKIIKVDSKNKVLDTFTDSLPVSGFEVKHIYNSALNNAQTLFYLSYSYYDEIGNSFDHFVIDNGKRISRLILASSSGDGGYSDFSNIYLPVRLTNGNKIVLAKNGVLSIDESTARPEIYTYPKDIGVPINELVVLEKGAAELIDDEKGDSKYNEDGTIAQDISIYETIYYRWDGNKLTQVKSIKAE